MEIVYAALSPINVPINSSLIHKKKGVVIVEQHLHFTARWQDIWFIWAGWWFAVGTMNSKFWLISPKYIVMWFLVHLYKFQAKLQYDHIPDMNWRWQDTEFF